MILDKKSCALCTKRHEFKATRSVENSRYLLQLFRAITSPSYILTTLKISMAECRIEENMIDPVTEVFRACQELRLYRHQDPTLQVESVFKLQ